MNLEFLTVEQIKKLRRKIMIQEIVNWIKINAKERFTITDVIRHAKANRELDLDGRNSDYKMLQRGEDND